MKPPANVKIGPHAYSVSFASSRTLRLHEASESVLGECDTQHSTIVIDPDQSDSQLRDSLIHEILHGAMHLIGVTEDPGIDSAAEERIVLRLSPVLLQLVKQRRLIKWLQEEP